ncbi:MAG: YMGG-like glycine zipper-containing protein [Rhodospirillales bacterium]
MNLTKLHTMRFRSFTWIAVFALLAVGACGSSTSDRALSGAGIGAGVGAVGGLLVGAPVEGAVIGGAIGAGTGALTDEDQIDLGDPAWK